MARAVTARHPILSLLLPIPIVCFTGALLTDLSYVNSGGNLLWVNFSSWLITAGLVFGGIAIVFLIVDGIRGSVSWLPFLLVGAGWVAEFLNALIHARDGWTAVVPVGMILSIIGVVLILAGGWLSRPARVVGDAR